jgi:hypothetical protein
MWNGGVLLTWIVCRGWQDLVAYGSQSLVVVVDPKTVQCLQTLTSHKSRVIKVSCALHDVV